MAIKPNVHTVRLHRTRIAGRSTYPFTVAAIAAFDALKIRERMLFLVGENGSGKSTFLEALALAMGFGPEGGTFNLSFSTRPSPKETTPDEPLLEFADALAISKTKRPRDGFFLRAESFFNVASAIDRLDAASAGGGLISDSYGGGSLHDRSHGESFMALAMNRFGPGGLFILDEPEAALSATRQMALMARMNDLIVADIDTQFIIATHSPILLAFPNAQIVSFDGGRMHEIAYRDTDPYVITRRFMEHPETMLRTLFEDEPEGGD
jgi:predicted ATPase